MSRPRQAQRAFLLLAGCLGLGCAMTGSYQSARVLEKGTSSIGLSFGVNRVSTGDSQVIIPTIIPEVSYHAGLEENLEVGGRIAPSSLGLEGDVKYRFLHRHGWHAALAPSLSYQGLFFMSGVTAGVPVIATRDFSDVFGFNLAAFGTYTNLSSGDKDISDVLKKIGGDVGTWGFCLGPEIHSGNFFMRPLVEFDRSYPLSGGEDKWSPFNRLSVVAQFGWVLESEKQQLDRIEKKLDEARPPQSK